MIDKTRSGGSLRWSSCSKHTTFDLIYSIYDDGLKVYIQVMTVEE